MTKLDKSKLVETLLSKSISISQVKGSREHLDIHGQVCVNDVIKLDSTILFLCISCYTTCSENFFYNGYALLRKFFTLGD